MRVHVSLMGDVCFPMPGFLTTHQGISPPPPLYPPGSPLLCLESPTPMMWPPGLALHQNKLTSTVFHKSQFIVVEEHDCGHMIPHITIPLANIKLPLDIAFSKRKVMFTSSKVRANGAQVATTEIFGPPVPLPMLCCGSPIPVPNGYPASNFLHTVSVGIRIGDIVAGLFAIAAEILGEVLCGKLKLKDAEFDELAAKLLGASTPREWGLKQILGGLAGCARLAATREGKLKVEGGSGYARARGWLEFTREGRNTLPGVRLNTANEQRTVALVANPNSTISLQYAHSEAGEKGIDSVQDTITSGTNDKPAEEKLQFTNTSATVADDGDTDLVVWQTTTTTPTKGPATSTIAGYTGSSFPEGSWGMPL